MRIWLCVGLAAAALVGGCGDDDEVGTIVDYSLTAKPQVAQRRPPPL